MATVIVTRAPADRQGPDVVDDLLTSELACRARGAREIDYNCSGRTIEDTSCTRRNHIPTGSLVDVIEDEERWRGKLTYWSLTIELGDADNILSIDTGIKIERERS